MKNATEKQPPYLCWRMSRLSTRNRSCRQGCGVGSPVIRLRFLLRLLAISIIPLRLQLRLRLRTGCDLQLY